MCKQIIEDHGFITYELVSENNILGIVYKHPYQIKRLLDEVSKLEGYTSFLLGQGRKKYVCKKENEENVKSNISKIQSIKTKSNNISKVTEIEDIFNYFKMNYWDIILSIERIHNILEDVFSIKQRGKRISIIKKLVRMKGFEKLGYPHIGKFKVTSNLIGEILK